MKRTVIFTIAALLGLVFSCQKDSLTGFSNEEAGWRYGGDEPFRGAPRMEAIEMDYVLSRVEALPNTFETRKPPKGAKVRMYGMQGNVTFLGGLDPGMSYEVHYLPPDKNPVKDTFDVWVEGVFLGSTDHYCLRYWGECRYYPEGRREPRYEFTGGTGPFEHTFGWVTGLGYGDAEGQLMKFEAAGKISMPPLEN